MKIQKLFATLVVIDKPEGGHFLKIYFPFDATGLSSPEIIDKILGLLPTAHVILIPKEGLYDVGKKAYRTNDVLAETSEETWLLHIDNYSKPEFHQDKVFTN